MVEKFELGQTLITPAALDTIPDEEIQIALGRHANGDWGNVADEDAEENNLSVEKGYRLLSSYKTSSGTEFWIITEADRTATTVLLQATTEKKVAIRSQPSWDLLFPTN